MKRLCFFHKSVIGRVMLCTFERESLKSVVMYDHNVMFTL